MSARPPTRVRQESSSSSDAGWGSGLLQPVTDSKSRADRHAPSSGRKIAAKTPSGSGRGRSKENIPQPTGTQAEIRARLQAFKQRKEAQPGKLPGKPPLPDTNPEPRKPVAKSLATPAPASGEARGRREGTAVAPTPRAEQQLRPSSAVPKAPATAGKSVARQASPKDDLARELQLQTWREMQWHHLSVRAEASMKARQSKAERLLARAAGMVVALGKQVAEEEIRLHRQQAESRLAVALRGQMPLLRALQPQQAELRASIADTTEALNKALLRVPLRGGAYVAGHPGDPSSAEEVLMRALGGAEAALRSQHPVVLGLLGERPPELAGGGEGQGEEQPDASGGSTPHEQASDARPDRQKEAGLPALARVSQELARTVKTEAALLRRCNALARELGDLHLHECSLRAHAMQIRSARAAELSLGGEPPGSTCSCSGERAQADPLTLP